jgi:hypothetical protein
LKKGLFFLVFSFPFLLIAQLSYTVLKKDSIVKQTIKLTPVAKYDSSMSAILKETLFVNNNSKPIASQYQVKRRISQNFFFYLLLLIMFLLAFLRLFYQRYFKNLFRVFFNTSLRQSQLTDQLLQAKLASLFFNLFFIITGGIYIYFLLGYFHLMKSEKIIPVMLYCMICLAVIYIGKFLALKFIGWLTGYTEVTDTYLFIVFLICKIVGILLVPVIIIMAFSELALVNWVSIISLTLIGLMLILRFFRSYGLLQNSLKVGRLHFFIYILGTEIVPLLLIYKGLLILVS